MLVDCDPAGRLVVVHDGPAAQSRGTMLLSEETFREASPRTKALLNLKRLRKEELS